ncbi:MAG: phage holin family protein [Rikenellaceae bacterium]
MINNDSGAYYLGRAIYGGCVAMTTALMNPVTEIILFLALLVLVDFITGVMASYHRAKDRNESWMFSSDKCWKTLYKLGVIVGVVLGFWFIDTRILTMHTLHLMPYSAAFICGAEMYSLVENGYDITKWDGFRLLLIFTQRKINKAVGEDTPLKRKD